MALSTSFLQDYKNSDTLAIDPLPFHADPNRQKEFDWILGKLKSKIIQARPSLAEETIILGSWMRISGDTLKAFKLHKTLLNRPLLTPDERTFLLIELGCDLFALKQGDMGVSYFQNVLVSNRKHPYALHMLSRVYEYLGEYQKASTLLKRLARITSKERSRLAYVISEHAYVTIESGNPSKAKKLSEEAMAMDPTCPAAALAFADSQLVAQQFKMAIETLKTFIKTWPQYTYMAVKRLEDAHYRQDRYSDLEDTLRDCLLHNPENAFILYSLGKVLRKKRRQDEGLQYFKDALKLRHLEIYSMRELIHYNVPEDHHNILSLGRTFFEELRKARNTRCNICHSKFSKMHWYCSKCGNWGSLTTRYDIAGS